MGIMTDYRNRILSLEYIPSGDLTAHPGNWRDHPKAQADALKGVLQLVSELTDTEVYHFWKTRFPNAPQWSRVLASNFVSLPVDSIVFTALAFVLLPPVFGAESMPLAQAITRIASGQILYKAVVTVLSLPLIYTIEDKPIDPNWQLAD